MGVGVGVGWVGVGWVGGVGWGGGGSRAARRDSCGGGLMGGAPAERARRGLKMNIGREGNVSVKAEQVKVGEDGVSGSSSGGEAGAD